MLSERKETATQAHPETPGALSQESADPPENTDPPENIDPAERIEPADRIDPERYSVTGLVVRARPEQHAGLIEQLERMAGVEVHGAGDNGNLVVTIEELDGERLTVDTLTRISTLPSVLSMSLIYNHSEDGAQSQEIR